MDETELLCRSTIASFDDGAANALDEAVSLADGLDVQLEAGVCGAGGDAPDELVWSLCSLTLDDGRQIVVGRSAQAGLTARGASGEAFAEFTLPTAPGEAVVLTEPSSSFMIRDADGVEIGSVTGG